MDDDTLAELDGILESIQSALLTTDFEIGSPAALRHLAANVMSLILALKFARQRSSHPTRKRR